MDFPDPAGPPTSTKPLDRRLRASTTGGRRSSLNDGILGGKSANGCGRETPFTVEIDPEPSYPGNMIGGISNLHFAILR